MTTLASHLATFLREYLPRERGCSPHTCDAYAYTFQILVCFAAKRLRKNPSSLNLDELDAPLILAFLEHLESARGNSASTRNARLAALKSFAHFVEYRDPSALDQIRHILAVPMKKTDETLVAYLDRVEAQALLDAPDPSTRTGIRDRAMLHVAYAGGLRVSELIGLRLGDVKMRRDTAIHVRGKGRRERILPMWKETAKALRAWLTVRGHPAQTEFFLNARGDPFTRSGFEYVLAKHVASAEKTCPSISAKQVSPHVLRHGCAMHILQATRDIRKVSLWLGHASIKSTEVYLRADPTQKLEALNASAAPSLRPGRFKAPDKLLEILRGTKPNSYA